MKKNLVSLVLCMALLSSLTVSASAYDVNDIYNQVYAIRNELGYPSGNWSSLRRAVNYIADHLPDSPADYSTVLSNIYKNTSSIDSVLDSIYGDTHSISAAIPSITQYLSSIITNIGTAQIAITNHIDSASAQNHMDLSSFHDSFVNSFSSAFSLNNSDYNSFDVYWGFDPSGALSSTRFSWSYLMSNLFASLVSDGDIFYSRDGSSRRSLYGIVRQLQQVLASDDDLALKNDNKANEDAATSDFVNGSSSKTSLGASDFGNLKDIGSNFNDLASLNGQSSISSFLSGLSSADGTGQGWFSEATRASLDAVSSPSSSGQRLVQKTWRGEKSMIYTLEADTSVVGVKSVPVAGSDVDPYNMDGFTDNYNWLWGDAS